MARRVTAEDIKRINEVYYACKNYAKTAQIVGWSNATVKKYVDPNFVPEQVYKTYDIKFPNIWEVTDNLKNCWNLNSLSTLTESERKEIEELWTELTI